MPIAVVTVQGLVNGVAPSASPTITPGGAPDGGSQLIQWQAELTSDINSGIIAKGQGTLFRPWDMGVALAREGNYTVRVRVQQVDWAWSPWASVNFRVNPQTPPNPALAVSNGKHATTGAPFAALAALFPTGYDYSRKILLDVQREDPTYGWVPFTQRFMTANERLVGIDDHGVPSGFTGRYRIRPTIWDATGQTLAGGWTYSLPFTLKAKRSSAYIVDPAHPEKSVRVVMLDREDRTHDLAASGTDLISPVPSLMLGGMSHTNAKMAQRVSTGLPSLPSGRITARCDDRQTFERALGILSSGAKLLFRGHRELDYAGREHVEPDQWMQVIDKVVEKDHVEYAHVSRIIEWAWVGAHPQGVSA